MKPFTRYGHRSQAGLGFAQSSSFPLDVNVADKQLLMRVPGIGILSAHKICAARKFRRITWEHLKKIGIAMNRTKYFIHTDNLFEKKDWQPWQIKQFILAEGNSKYKRNFSPQASLF